MALDNVDSPRGFSLIRSGRGESVNRVERVVDGTVARTLAVGDCYQLDASGQASRAEADDTVRGVVESIVLAPVVGSAEGPVSQHYLPASTAGKIIGIEDPRAKFEVQITTMAVTDEEKLADHVDGAASATLGQSRQELDGSTLGTGDQFRVHAKVDSPADNAYGANCRVICSLQNVLQ